MTPGWSATSPASWSTSAPPPRTPSPPPADSGSTRGRVRGAPDVPDIVRGAQWRCQGDALDTDPKEVPNHERHPPELRPAGSGPTAGGAGPGRRCAGLGRRFGIAPWPARILFVLLLMVIPGSQILIYPILWILMPSEQTVTRPTRPRTGPRRLTRRRGAPKEFVRNPWPSLRLCAASHRPGRAEPGVGGHPS